MTTTMTINETKLHELMGKMVGDLGAAANGALVVLGDRLGLFSAIAEHGLLDERAKVPCTATCFHDRYLSLRVHCMSRPGPTEGKT